VIYAQTPTYVAGTAIKELISPNFNNLIYHVEYNNRLQPTEVWTGAAQGTTALRVQLHYSISNTLAGPRGATTAISTPSPTSRMRPALRRSLMMC
jgi:hypothetical protein